MKKCGQCGSLNDNAHSVCTECGNKLGAPLTKREEEEAVSALESLDYDYQDRLYADPFEVTTADRVFGFLSLAGIVISIVLLILLPVGTEKLSFLLSGFLFIGCILEVFCANAFWRLHKSISALRYRNSESLEPSDLSLKARKAAIYLSFILGMLLIIFYIFAYESGILDFLTGYRFSLALQ